MSLHFDKQQANDKKWFEVPTLEFQLQLSHAKRSEIVKMSKLSTVIDFDKKTRAKNERIDAELAQQNFDKLLISHIHGWKDIFGKEKGGKATPLEFTPENLDAIIDNFSVVIVEKQLHLIGNAFE